MTDYIPLAVPHLAGNERRYLEECVATNYVSQVGPFVERFEREFAAFVGARHAVACSSGTSALHVAMRLAGADRGGLVPLSTFTFIASANAVTYTGADPLLVDSETTTWNLDGRLLHDHVVGLSQRGEPLPSVIQAVHILGHPADLEPLMALRERFGIRIVEDAAEALGATYSAGPYAGRYVGTIGDFGCFSFNGNKVITTGNGGMLVTDDPDLARRAKHLTTQAKLANRRGYHHDEIGYNYRLSNVAAALGVAQLEQLGGFLEAKHAIAGRYDDALRDLPLTLPPRVPWATSSDWLYSVLLDGGPDTRDSVLDHLEVGGVGARPLWPPVHDQAPYRDAARLGGAVAESIYGRGISLPSSVSLTAEDQTRVVEVLTGTLRTVT